MTSRKIDMTIPNVPYPTAARGLVLGPNGRLSMSQMPEGIEAGIGEEGPPGPQGAPGPVGPGGGSTYIHTQGSPSATWVVVHSLGWFPSVTVVDTGDTVIIPDVHYDSTSQATLGFGSPTSGKAYLNPGAPVSPTALNYLHTQNVGATVWPVTHNLGRYPSVTVADVGGSSIMFADVIYTSLNTLDILFLVPTTGRAYLI